MSQGMQEDGVWEMVAWAFVERVIGGMKLYFEVPLWIRTLLVVGIDPMHGGAVPASLQKMQPARSNVVLLEMCSCSFLLSSLALRAGTQGINHVAIICTGLNEGRGISLLLNSNSEFPTREGNSWVFVAQTHVFWGPTLPWQILWPTLLTFCMVRDYVVWKLRMLQWPFSSCFLFTNLGKFQGTVTVRAE